MFEHTIITSSFCSQGFLLWLVVVFGVDSMGKKIGRR